MLTTMGEALKKAGLVSEEDEKRAVERYLKDEAEANELLREFDKVEAQKKLKNGEIAAEQRHLAAAQEKLTRFTKQKVREKLISAAKESVRESQIRLGKLKRDATKIDLRLEILVKQLQAIRERL